jgi:hypothetical protein
MVPKDKPKVALAMLQAFIMKELMINEKSE